MTRLIVILALLFFFRAGATRAMNLTWDVAADGNGVITDGSGEWSVGGANWNTGAGDTNWFDGNSAIIGGGTLGTTGTVSITTGVSVNSLTFNAPHGGGSYTVSNGALTLTTPAAITNNANGTISSIITGSAGLTKVGAGTLTLSGSNTYGGATTIGAGTLALAGGSDRLPGTSTLSFSGSGGFDVGATSQTLAHITVANNVTGTIIGNGGTLNLGTNAFVINGSGSAVLTLSGLGNFNYNNSNLTFNAGGNTAASTATTLTLSPNSTITASACYIGMDGGVTLNRAVTLNLGSNTTINATAIYAGYYNQDGTLQYGNSTTNPVLTLRGATTERVNDMRVGRNSAGVNSSVGKVDLTSNVSGGSKLDAKINSLVVGVDDRGSNGGAAMGVIGSFTMGGGTLDATTLTIGQITSNSTESAASTVAGTLSTGPSNAIVKVGSLYLGDNYINAVNFTVTSTFNLNSGATLYTQTIAQGPGTGTAGTWNRVFNWNDGTITTYDTNTDLAVGSGIVFNLAATGTHVFNIDADRSGSVASVLAGTGGTLVKSGTGTLTLTGVNTYSGATTVNGGVLTIGGAGKLGNGNYPGTVSVAGGSVLTYASTAAQTFGGVLSGSGTLNIQSGLLTLKSAQMTGGGAVNVATGASLGASGTIEGSLVVADGGALVTGGAGAVGSLLIGTLTLPGSATNVFDFAERGISNDVLGVAGVLTASDNRIAVNLLDPSQPPTNGSYRLVNYGTLVGSFVPPVVGPNSTRKILSLDTSTPGAINLIVSGSTSNLVWNPTGVSSNLWNVLGNASWTNTDLGSVSDFANGDTVTFTDLGVAYVNGAVDIATVVSPAAVVVNSGGDYTLGGAGRISGGMTSLLKDGAGMLSMGLSNDFAGGVTISNGVIRSANSGALGSGSVMVAAGAALELTNAVTVANILVISGMGMGGTGALRSTTANNTFSGAITLGEATRIHSDAGTLTLSGATLTTAGYGLTFGGAGNGLCSSVISGTGSLTKEGGGTLRLTAVNNYSGGTTISQGVLVVGNGSTLGFISGAITVNTNGTLAFDRTGSTTFSNTLTGSGNVENRNGQIYYSGNMSAFSGTFTAIPGSRLDFTGGSGSTGAVFVVNGAVYISATGLTVNMGELSGSSAGAITAGGGATGGTLVVGALNTDSTFRGTLSGNTGRAFTKTGTGKLTLTGVNSYPGTTTVNGGGLIVDGKITGTGAVTVNSGGTLGGTGIVAGATTVATGATLSLGDPVVNGGIGTLTISNSVTLASNATFAVELTAAGLADKLVSVGNVTNQAASLSVSIINEQPRIGTKYTVMMASNIVGTFRGLPEGASFSAAGSRFAVSYPGATNVVLAVVSAGTLIMVQ